MLRVKAVVYAAIGVAVALVFLPLWLAVPVAALLGVYGLAMAALGASVTLDTDAGLLRMRLGPVFRRVRLTNVAAVLVEANKVSIKRVNGWEYSLYAWGKGPLDRLLRVPTGRRHRPRDLPGCRARHGSRGRGRRGPGRAWPGAGRGRAG